MGSQVTENTKRKNFIINFFDQLAPERKSWINKNLAFHANDIKYMRFLIPPNQKILELGCGTGHLLSELSPSIGVGVDFSRRMIDIARSENPNLDFHVGDIEDPKFVRLLKGPYDYIVLSDSIGMFEDIESTLTNLHQLCSPDTRIVLAYYSQIWNPILKIGEYLKFKMPQVEQNWLGLRDLERLFNLSNFEVVRREWRQLIPKNCFGIGNLINRYLATLPFIRYLCLRNYLVVRSRNVCCDLPKSVTVLIPCRNEEGNVEPAIRRIPDFCDDLEILFVEGHSTDRTLSEINRVITKYPGKNIKLLKQPGRGKGDAVRAGFEVSEGQILMILDADLTVPPEMLPNFYRAIASGKGEFINGSRLIYPMEEEAMRFLNQLANRLFSMILSWLMSQTVTDTLCGTKVLSKQHYKRIAENRYYFGDFDPFGDFDLLFGADKLNLKIIEVPVRYAARYYGQTQISRFRDGWKLMRMVGFAYRKLKAF
jgi:SAM-dependent methyltransferase